MKKAFSLLLLAVVVLCGCSSNDDELTTNYTEAQNKVFALFNGTWADTQFSNLGTYPGAELQHDPDKIVFGTHYQTEKEIKNTDYMNDGTTAFFAQGECSYLAYDQFTDGGTYNETKCYYYVSAAGDALTLWDVERNKQFHYYTMNVKSTTQISLKLSSLSLPYIFVKQN